MTAAAVSLPCWRPTPGQLAEAPIVRGLLIGTAVVFLGIFLIAPLAVVFVQAFAKGVPAYLSSLADAEAQTAIRLTLLTAGLVVPLNVLFGVAAAWAIARFEFVGKQLLVTLIDLPFVVSPVIAGMVFVLLFGGQGLLAPWLAWAELKVIFAVPGIVLVTMFVTVPFVARELIPTLQMAGREEDEAALMLGASGWQMFRRVTLPAIRCSVLYGVLLCTARAMGEFGAVSVVSAHIRGETNTIPLHVEVLYNEYNFAGAFAVASLLALQALATLGFKRLIEWRAAL